MTSDNNTVWHKGHIAKQARNRLNRNDIGVIWFTGLSASGKSSIEHLSGINLNLHYLEGYVKCDLEECIRRDPKRLYEKARSRIIKNYTGISSPFEEPDTPTLSSIPLF